MVDGGDYIELAGWKTVSNIIQRVRFSICYHFNKLFLECADTVCEFLHPLNIRFFCLLLIQVQWSHTTRDPSIKYVTLFLANFNPLPLSHFVTHPGTPKSMYFMDGPKTVDLKLPEYRIYLC